MADRMVSAQAQFVSTGGVSWGLTIASDRIMITPSNQITQSKTKAHTCSACFVTGRAV